MTTISRRDETGTLVDIILTPEEIEVRGQCTDRSVAVQLIPKLRWCWALSHKG